MTELEEERKAIMEYEAEVEAMYEAKRTAKQNRAEHAWFTELADCLNTSGISVQDIVKRPIKWDKELVKRYLFMRVAEKMYKKTSSADLTKEENIAVANALAEKMQEFECFAPFPSKTAWRD